jgi:hypothetical protein
VDLAEHQRELVDFRKRLLTVWETLLSERNYDCDNQDNGTTNVTAAGSNNAAKANLDDRQRRDINNHCGRSGVIAINYRSATNHGD